MALEIDSVPVSSASSLAPGFRFHPTDEELVRYYLRRKVCGKSFRFDAISDVDVYKVEPWDLPGLSRLKTRDLEWYFFSVLDKKYGNGSRTNRATDRGYWKTTGKDRAVYHRSQPVGMKKTLVYHCGRAPRGERTNWVMHEYRLIDQELENAGIPQDAFVLCRIFHKSGSGPKNGEKYGAPFIEEEWEDDELVFVSKEEDYAEELAVVDDDSYLDANDIEQILGTNTSEEDSFLPSDLSHGDHLNSADISTAMVNDPQKLLVGVGEADTNDGPKLFNLPVQNGMDPKSVKHEYIGEPSNTTSFDMDYLLDEPYFDANSGDFVLDERSFFEANDLENATATETDPDLGLLDDYVSFFDPDMDNLECTFDPIGSENILQDSSLTLENAYEGTHQATENAASSSKKGHSDQATDITYPFLKKASTMLGSISSPPAFASEFPTKYLASASQASSPVHVTAGMIHVRNASFSADSTVDWSLDKHSHVNITLSISLDSQKANATVSQTWFYCILVWILVLSLTSLKIGTLICPGSVMS